MAAVDATTWLSSVAKNTRPSAYAAPRLMWPLQPTPGAAGMNGGAYFHFTAPCAARSSAYSSLGKGVTTYIVVPTTSGVPSCPYGLPVDQVHATRSPRTLAAVISVSPL